MSAGDLPYKELLRDFWKDFHAAVGEIGDLRTSQVLDSLNDALGPMIFPERADGADPRACPSCGHGKLSLKTSRFGAFIGCSNYPECRYTRPIATPDGEENGEAGGDRELGLDPKSSEKVWLKAGRFGPYVQLGEGEKPRRSSLPKGWTPGALDLDQALRLLSLPREVGKDPEDGQPIYAGLGRYGPYVQHNKTYASLGSIEEAFDVGLNRAVTLIAEKKAGGGRGARGGGAAALKELGEHPETGKPVRILSGRFGPYIKHEDVNANVPRGKDPQEVTLEEAVALLAERAAKGGGGKAKKPARAKAAAEKPAAVKKKPAAKKKAPAKTPAKAKVG